MKPISTRQLHRIVVDAAQAAEITKRVGPHTLRHYVSFLTMSGNICSSPIFSVNISSPWRYSLSSLDQACRSERSTTNA